MTGPANFVIKCTTDLSITVQKFYYQKNDAAMRNYVLLIRPVYPAPKIFFRKKQVRLHARFSHLLLLTFFSCFSLFCVAQQKITGRVVSGDSAITGATIQVKGATTFTKTDET